MHTKNSRCARGSACLTGIAAITLFSGLVVSAAEDAGPNVIQIQNSCSYSEKLDTLGTEPWEYKIDAGARFMLKGMRDGAPSYCGQASMHQWPYGWMSLDLCVATKNGMLVQRPESNRTVPEQIETAYQEADFAPWAGNRARASVNVSAM